MQGGPADYERSGLLFEAIVAATINIDVSVPASVAYILLKRSIVPERCG